MAVNLAERQIGFHATTLGFPSIETCMAIVYVTGGGLYGFHNFGGNDPTQFADKANAFFNGINQITGGAAFPAGSRLYGITHVNARGGKTRWIAELTAFATKLNFTGRISGYDLDDFTKTGRSAYVEFRKAGDKCNVYVEDWDTVKDRVAPGANPWGANLIGTRPTSTGTVLAAPGNAFVNIPTTGALKKISKTKLR